jgi:predicted ArsR family transcriptional regulator
MSEIARQADFVALMVKRPRIASEVADLIGVSPNTVRGWLEIYAAEGLVRQTAEKRIVHNSAAAVWEWAA